jgi:hypothetical protein
LNVENTNWYPFGLDLQFSEHYQKREEKKTKQRNQKGNRCDCKGTKLILLNFWAVIDPRIGIE